ncbi:MAG: hypothetical protein IT462_05840, partial [Planctomycetes bacterium]|nr:hypothetical protein [Planctomycetota bacterium]
MNRLVAIRGWPLRLALLYFSAVALSALAGFAFGGCDKPARSQPGYDPLSVALASVGKTR